MKNKTLFIMKKKYFNNINLLLYIYCKTYTVNCNILLIESFVYILNISVFQ